MEGLAVVGVVFVLIVVGYFGVSAVLRRIPAPSLRLPTGPIPDTWPGIVEHNVPLARSPGSDTWTSVTTNVATSASVPYGEAFNVNVLRFYRVGRLSNP